MLFHKVNEIDSQEFFKMPKGLYTNNKYKNLSDGARCAYTIMLNRMSVSKKNNWCDEKGNIFIIYSVKDLAEFMGKSERTISRYKKELEKHGLIYEIRQGLNRPNLIYVLKVMSGQKGTKMSDTLSKNNKSNTNNNNNKDTNNLEDTTNDDETVDNESVVINSDSKEKESNTQESDNHEDKHEQKNESEQDNRFYKLDDVKRLFSLAKQVSSSITMSLIKNLLKRYSYKQIQEKLLYMQKFKQRNTIYNPAGFLVQALKHDYTFIDKAKVILDKANTAIQKTKEYFKQFRNNNVADRETSLDYLQSMKLKLQNVY